MMLEEKLLTLTAEKNLAKKHAIALTILDEVLQNLTGQLPEHVKTKDGTRVSYGNFWYHEAQAIKVKIPASNSGERLARSLDGAADAIEMVLLTGAPKDKCIIVYEHETPLFSLVFGFDGPRIFVPAINCSSRNNYFDVLQFMCDAENLLSM